MYPPTFYLVLQVLVYRISHTVLKWKSSNLNCEKNNNLNYSKARFKVFKLTVYFFYVHFLWTNSQDRTNQQYLGMVQRVLATPGFYYSHSYDLSHCHQRQYHLTQTKPHFSQLPLHERADERFVWNTHLLRDLVVQPELRRFIVPITHGYVSTKGCTINGKPFVFVVISRRSVHRAGESRVRYT